MTESSVVHKMQRNQSKPRLGIAFAIVVVLALLMVHSMLAGPFFFLIFGVLAVVMVPALLWLRHEDKKQKALEKQQKHSR